MSLVGSSRTVTVEASKLQTELQTKGNGVKRSLDLLAEGVRNSTREPRPSLIYSKYRDGLNKNEKKAKTSNIQEEDSYSEGNTTADSGNTTPEIYSVDDDFSCALETPGKKGWGKAFRDFQATQKSKGTPFSVSKVFATPLPATDLQQEASGQYLEWFDFRDMGSPDGVGEYLSPWKEGTFSSPSFHGLSPFFTK